jgi:predicted anti-sigma-YlaC factor YlaD
LDGEPLGLPAAELDDHLAGCQDCALWLDTASRLGRAFRVTSELGPDLSGVILEQVVSPAARVDRYRRRLRISLGVLGFVQWALAMPALFGDNVGMQMNMHASHESAAWNFALGAAFLAVAVKPARASGTLPVLVPFVLLLAVFSVPDIAAGTVAASRLASHAGIVVGLALIGLLTRSQRLLPQGRGAVYGTPTADTQSHPFGKKRGAA